MGFIALSFSYSGAALVVGLIEAPDWGLLTNSLKGTFTVALGAAANCKDSQKILALF